MSASGQRRGSTKLLLGIAGVVVLLAVVFGVTTLRQRAAYREYRAQTIEAGPPPWASEAYSVTECVRASVDWAMACPGVESWCAGEAPRLTLECLASRDRSEYCREVGDRVDQTGFGYATCEALREEIEGRYTKRSHKKFCAASFRAVAAHCKAEGDR